MKADYPRRCSFETFKNNVCHRLKNLGDIDFLIATIEGDDIFEAVRNEHDHLLVNGDEIWYTKNIKGSIWL